MVAHIAYIIKKIVKLKSLHAYMLSILKKDQEGPEHSL